VNDQNTTDGDALNPNDSPPRPPRQDRPSVVPPQPSQPPTSSLPVQVPAAGPGEDPEPRDSKQTLLKIGLVVTGLILLGLLTWWLTALLATGNGPSAGATASAESTPSAQPTRSQLPQEGVGALDYRLGDCFQDFDPEATESTVVACTAGHSAQLVAVHRYPDTDSYPGIAALRDKGREICLGAELTDGVSKYVLLQRNSYPSDTSWAKGDRRVDCYVTADKGNIIMESLIP
jgi:Septum formation